MVKKLRLSIKDRLKLLRRAVIVAFMPNVRQVNVIWQEEVGDIKQHAFFVDGINPTDMTFLYFSYVAGNSDTFEDLTRRTKFLLNKIAVAYALYNKVSSKSIQYTPEPFRLVRKLNLHLLARNFDPDLYENIVLNHEENVLTVYLHCLNGKLVGYQQYRPDCNDKRTNNPKLARYFTYRTPGNIAVWGLETLDYSRKRLYVVEGIFKASALHMLGHNAVALLTGSPSIDMLNWLRSLPFELYAIGDNDDTGKRLVRAVGNGTCFEKDVDEYSLEELESLLGSSQI